MSQTDSVSLVTDHELQAFVDGELDGRRYRRIVAHLATDPVAAERVNGFLRQQGELAQLRDQLADIDPLSDPITADLTLQLAGSVRHQRRVRMGVLGAGLMASALVGLVTWWGPNASEMAHRLNWSRQVVASGPQMLFGRDPFSGVAQLAATEAGDAPLKLDEQLAAYSMRRPDLGAHGLRFMVRLVKGAYWDGEVKRAQEGGLPGYPVFTHKHHTDLSYLACAQALIGHHAVIYPQFATHNAGTIAAILQMARKSGAASPVANWSLPPTMRNPSNPSPDTWCNAVIHAAIS